MEMIATASAEKALYDLIRVRPAENPIRRDTLVRVMNLQGYGIRDRSMRNLVVKLRKMGYLICSTTNGGYYLARSMEEYNDFKQREYKAKIMDMAETMRAMDRSAVERFGEQVQLDLFYL